MSAFVLDVLLGATVFAQVADGVTTILCLRYASLAEGNPLALRLMRRIGIKTATAALKGGSICLAFVVWWCPLAQLTKLAILAGAAGLTSWAAIGNFRLWRAARRAS